MNVFEQTDYKQILNALVSEKRKTQKGLSRKLSEYLGVHPTLVSQVLAGSKDFTEEQLLSVCEYLGIPKLESRYLLALLQRERAGSKLLKDHFQDVIDQTRSQALQVSSRIHEDRNLTDTEKAVFYSSWVYSAIHLLSTLDRPLSFEGICARLNLLPARTREVLDFLIQSELVAEVNGRFVGGATTTHLERGSPFLVRHHTNWRLKAAVAAENLTEGELMYSANVSLSRADFARLREELLQVIQRFVSEVRKSPAEDIAQFNLDFFWVRP